jgi:threonine aldolase
MPRLTHSFASDNYAGVHPDVLAAILAADGGHEVAYGEDSATEELARLVDDGVGLVLLDGARRDHSGWFGNPPPAGAAAALATAKGNLDRCVSGASFGHDVYVYLLPDAPRCTD